jgi:hypothetical protein
MIMYVMQMPASSSERQKATRELVEGLARVHRKRVEQCCCWALRQPSA